MIEIIRPVLVDTRNNVGAIIIMMVTINASVKSGRRHNNNTYTAKRESYEWLCVCVGSMTIIIIVNRIIRKRK